MPSRQTVRRNELHATLDARAQATRDRLSAAYRELMAAGNGMVSVLAVCHAAGVARSTFYTHYEAVEDLAVATIADEFSRASALDVQRRTQREGSGADITQAGLVRMITTLEDQREVVLAVTQLASRAAIVGRLVKSVSAAVRAALEAKDSELGQQAVTVTAEFVAAGTVHAILLWLEQDNRDQEEIVRLLMALMPGAITE